MLPALANIDFSELYSTLKVVLAELSAAENGMQMLLALAKALPTVMSLFHHG